MATKSSEAHLLMRATAGQRHAFQTLLLTCYDRLAAFVRQRLPQRMDGIVDAEGILQTSIMQAWRDIRSFRPNGPDAFYRWLVRIVEHELQDALKAAQAAKRDYRRRAGDFARGGSGDSMADLLALVAIHCSTPSRAAARREAERALMTALQGLKDEYRQALQMRYIDGLSVPQVAARMNRTEGSVMMLCNRGVKKLREALGQPSRYLTNT